MTEAEINRVASRTKRLRVALLALLAVYLLGWITANLVLNSGAMKRKIGERVAQVAGSPLEIGKIGMTPFGTIRLSDLKIEVGGESGAEEAGDSTAADPPPLFHSAGMRVRVGFFSLLTNSIRVKSVLLEEPVFALMRGEDGGFLLPKGFLGGEPSLAEGSGAEDEGDPGDPGDPGGKETAGDAVPVLPPEFGKGSDLSSPEAPAVNDAAQEKEKETEAVTAKSSGEAASIATTQAGEKRKPIGPQALIIRMGKRRLFFDDLVMRKGRVEVTSSDEGRRILEVEDMEMRFAVGQGSAGEGTFTAKKAVLFDTVEAENLRSKTAIRGIMVSFTEFEADMAGGRVEGGFEASPLYKGLPFIAELKVGGVSVPRLLERVESELGIDRGVLAGGVQMIGILRAPQSWKARGAFKVGGAHVDKFGFLAPLSGAIDTKGLEDFAFDEMGFRFQVQGGNVRIDDMRVSSPEIVMSGRGYINFQGQVSFASRLYVSAAAHYAVQMIEERLPEGMSLGYQPYGSGERYYRDYLIQGDARNPVINFWAPEQGVPVGQLREQILKLLGR